MTACGDGGMSPHTFKASVMEACPLIYLLMSACAANAFVSTARRTAFLAAACTQNFKAIAHHPKEEDQVLLALEKHIPSMTEEDTNAALVDGAAKAKARQDYEAQLELEARGVAAGDMTMVFTDVEKSTTLPDLYQHILSHFACKVLATEPAEKTLKACIAHDATVQTSGHEFVTSVSQALSKSAVWKDLYELAGHILPVHMSFFVEWLNLANMLVSPMTVAENCSLFDSWNRRALEASLAASSRAEEEAVAAAAAAAAGERQPEQVSSEAAAAAPNFDGAGEDFDQPAAAHTAAGGAQGIEAAREVMHEGTLLKLGQTWMCGTAPDCVADERYEATIQEIKVAGDGTYSVFVVPVADAEMVEELPLDRMFSLVVGAGSGQVEGGGRTSNRMLS